MSEEFKSMITAEEPTTDLTEKDMKIVNRYIEEGLPNIATVTDVQIRTMMDLYLDGKPYRQISNIMNVKKDIIMYLSHKFSWFILRKEYLEDLEKIHRARLIEARITNADFILQMQTFFKKKIGSKMNKYLATGNEQFANDVDLKDIDKYLKTVEILERLSSERSSSGGPAPAVGLNLGENGVTIVKNGDNSVDITPKNKTIGEALKKFADYRREEEKKKD